MRQGSFIYYSKIAAVGAVKSIMGGEAKSYLAEKLLEIPGLPAKIGQQISTQLGWVQKPNLSLMQLPLVKNLIESRNREFSQNIVTIDERGIAASLGQLHKVVLENTDSYAVKVQYPHVDEEIEQQVRNLLKFAKHGPPKKYQMDVENYCSFMIQQMQCETDYRTEGRQQERFRLALPTDSPVVIPKVDLKESRKHLLVQEYVPSIGIDTLCQWWPKQDRYRIGETIFKNFLHNLFRLGAVHGDFHPGNWGAQMGGHIDRGPHLVIYDFGAIVEIEASAKATLLDFINSPMSAKSAEEGYEFFVRLGFDSEKLAYIYPKLGNLFQIIFEPIFCEEIFNFCDWSVHKKIVALLGEDRWWFRTAGPPWFLYFLRSIQGMIFALRKLEVALPVRKMVMDAVRIHPTPELPVSQLKKLTTQYHHQDQKTVNHLQIQVSDNGEEIVRLTMPARSVTDIEHLIPEEVMSKIGASIDILAIKKNAIASGFQPQVLFDRKLNQRRYRVWLG